MELYKTITSLQNALQGERSKGLKIGFVPTMGALHEGHLSLVQKAGDICDIVVVSIFVNPTQFNDKNDLANYPRTLESDLKILSGAKCDYIFYPSVEEVYPVPDNRKFNFRNIETVMEGAFRPGHFNGVAQVVSRLLEIVHPDKAFFGQKDYQQIAVIKDLVRQMKIPVEIVSCRIVREKDGLAMSSRNKLLLPEYRNIAPLIYETLKEAKDLSKSKPVTEVKAFVINKINNSELLRVEYFEIVDDTTLIPVDDWAKTPKAVGCIAVYAGKVRLIDNIIFDFN
jgi:pantoate--beta-alanine ligase